MAMPAAASSWARTRSGSLFNWPATTGMCPSARAARASRDPMNPLPPVIKNFIAQLPPQSGLRRAMMLKLALGFRDLRVSLRIAPPEQFLHAASGGGDGGQTRMRAGAKIGSS